MTLQWGAFRSYGDFKKIRAGVLLEKTPEVSKAICQRMLSLSTK
jgi:hypothetical protein